jgi:hypothetical protein
MTNLARHEPSSNYNVSKNCPWYPTATLYRQKKDGDWDEVVQRLKSDLITLT